MNAISAVSRVLPYATIREIGVRLGIDVADDFITISDAARILDRSEEDLIRDVDGGASPIPVRVQTIDAAKDRYLRGLDALGLDEYLRFGTVKTWRLICDANFQNRIRRWLSETCVRDPRGKIAAKELHDRYVETTDHTGKYGSGLTDKAFKATLLAIGIERKRGNRVVEWRGIRAKRDADYEPGGLLDPASFRLLTKEAASDSDYWLSRPNPDHPRFSWDEPSPGEVQSARWLALMSQFDNDQDAVYTALHGAPMVTIHGGTPNPAYDQFLAVGSPKAFLAGRLPVAIAAMAGD